ncbi:mitochondrial distribution and morphology protein family 31/32 [Lipomyces japonicus]|uniref:mitochondrial distribution and morphology protein family 31/32 n=1 Tax=Lipomyces japonicus TaxID=56871 RepID=UPI0034CE64D0
MPANKHNEDSVPKPKSPSNDSNLAKGEHKGQNTNESVHSETWGEAVSKRLPHTPTKEELLNAANGALERFRIRFKWVLLRQVRPFNMDDMSAFFSWLIVGNVLWILLGSTTFVSLVLLTANTVFAQESLARIVGYYLTKETGVTVVFESAIVPNWTDGVISFKNVFVSRRPGRPGKGVVKGSQATAAAAAAAAAAASASSYGNTNIVEENEDDGNYTQFDLTVENINVTISVRRWINGRGLLKDVEVKGIRGVVDRTFVRWLPGVDPRSYKKVHRPGDFEFDHFVLEDALVTVQQPDEFRPFDISIFSCDLPQLRRQWLFYDFLCANHVSGAYDDSLFTIHPRQTVNDFNGEEKDEISKRTWKKTSRLRIDNVNIDHLNRGIEGPFSWITSGNVDIIADLMIPNDEDEAILKRFMQDIVMRWEWNIATRKDRNRSANPGGIEDSDQASEPWDVKFKRMVESFKSKNKIELDGVAVKIAPVRSEALARREAEKYIVFDLHVQLNSARASLPLFAPELSYVNNALIRPMVAYINATKTYIPINCRVVKKLTEFDGSWTIFDSGLMDDLSAEVYEAISANVQDEEERARRMRKVGMWAAQLFLEIVFMSIGTFAF